MRVLVIGSTGALGRPAIGFLREAGHQVTGLTSSPERAVAIAALGIEPAVGDLFDPESLAGALAGQEAVINLATRIPPANKAARPSAWRENDHIRRDGSASLVTAALASPDVRVIVQEGVSFGYVDGGDTELTESAPVDAPAAIVTSGIAADNVAGFAAAGDGRVAVPLRIALLMGDDPLTGAMIGLIRKGLPGLFGKKDGWMTTIRHVDAAAAAVAALAAPSGVYNVGGAPIRKREMAGVLAEVAGVRRVRFLPTWLAGLTGTAALARSQRVVSTALSEATGWQPADPKPNPRWFGRLASTKR